MPALTTRQRLLLSATAITTAAAAVGLGSAASWSDSETTSETVESGSFSLLLEGQLVKDVMIPVVSFAPGDSVTRPLEVRNNGDVDFAGVSMTMSGGFDSSPALLDGTAKGLQVQVLQCGGPWERAHGGGGVHGWACTGQEFGPLGDYAYDSIRGEHVFVGAWNGEWTHQGEGHYEYAGYGYRQVEGIPQVVRDGAFGPEEAHLPSGALVSARYPRHDAGLNSNGYDQHGAPSSVAHLLVTVSMPEATGAGQDVDDFDSDYQRYGNQRASIEYRFTAVQRAGNEVEQHSQDPQTYELVNDANLRSYHQYPG